MTTAQPQYQAAHRISGTGDDGRDTAGPRVRDDMTVEVALSLMAGARVDHLVLCDGDDQSTGTVTRERLAVLRGSAAYTDRIRLRDVHVLDTSVTPVTLVTLVTGRCHRELGVAALAS